MVIMQGDEQVQQSHQTVDGLLHLLGLQKYAILFKAEEVCNSFVFVSVNEIILSWYFFLKSN